MPRKAIPTYTHHINISLTLRDSEQTDDLIAGALLEHGNPPWFRQMLEEDADTADRAVLALPWDVKVALFQVLVPKQSIGQDGITALEEVYDFFDKGRLEPTPTQTRKLNQALTNVRSLLQGEYKRLREETEQKAAQQSKAQLRQTVEESPDEVVAMLTHIGYTVQPPYYVRAAAKAKAVSKKPASTAKAKVKAKPKTATKSKAAKPEAAAKPKTAYERARDRGLLRDAPATAAQPQDNGEQPTTPAIMPLLPGENSHEGE